MLRRALRSRSYSKESVPSSPVPIGGRGLTRDFALFCTITRCWGRSLFAHRAEKKPEVMGASRNGFYPRPTIHHRSLARVGGGWWLVCSRSHIPPASQSASQPTGQHPQRSLVCGTRDVMSSEEAWLLRLEHPEKIDGRWSGTCATTHNARLVMKQKPLTKGSRRSCIGIVHWMNGETCLSLQSLQSMDRDQANPRTGP